MSEHYHDIGDLRFLKDMGKLAPTEFNAWLGLDKIVGHSEEIPRTHCTGCCLHDAMPLLHRSARKSRKDRGRLARGSYRKHAPCSRAARRGSGNARGHGVEILRVTLKSIIA